MGSSVVLGIVNVNVDLLLIQLLNGLALGVLYVLMASGLSVIFGITDILNFAHGVLYMLGAYLGYMVIGATGSYFVALLLAPVLVAVIGMSVERATLNRIYDREPLYHILLTFGLVLIVTDLVRLIWGSQPKFFSAPPMLTGATKLGSIYYPTFRLFTIGAGAVIAIATWLLLRYTKFGLIVRAGAQDQQMVRLMGVDMAKYFTLVFGLGAFLAGTAGVLAAPFRNVSPTMGNSILIIAFIIVIVGGMGSYLGSVIAAFVIAFAETLTIVFAEQFTGYMIYIIMFAILLVRPQGILGTYEIREELAKLSFTETIDPVRLTDRHVLAVLGALAVLPLLPHRLLSSYYLGLISLMFIWGLLALSLDIVMGYIGLISFGHAAFFGVGAYAVALTTSDVTNSFLLGVAVAVVATTILAWLVGALSVRFSGVYFAMITFAVAQFIYQFSVSMPNLTGGSNGMAITTTELLGILDLTDPDVFYYVALGTLVGSYYVAVRVMDSPFGRVLTAIRESERRAAFLGYHTNKYKRRAFALSGAIGGLAGVLFVTYQQFISPNALYWFVSGDALFAMIFGGIGTLYGPILGGAALIGIEEILSSYLQQYRLVLGVILILVVMFAPRGLASILTEARSRLSAFEPGRARAAKESDPVDDDTAANTEDRP